MVFAEPSRSKSPMTATSDVSLKKPMKVLTRAGITIRSAWGSTTSRRRRPERQAEAGGGFVLAGGMACRPARMTSAR